jgi:predicted aldo/keto reductase-like oxidoreductase
LRKIFASIFMVRVRTRPVHARFNRVVPFLNRYPQGLLVVGFVRDVMQGNNRLRVLIGNSPRVGLGGEGVLRTEGRDNEAVAVIAAAFDGGIRYFDSAPAYAGSERYQGIYWSHHPEQKSVTFQAGKSAQRDAEGARVDLSRSLDRLGRDHIDLWQIHDLRSKEDLRRIEGDGGALAEFYRARDEGTVRAVGATGHHDPSILLHAVRNWDIDSVLLPVNPVEAVIGGFTDKVIHAARERGIGVIGMKALGAGNYLFPDAGLAPETLIRFALSQDVDLIIVGCSTSDEARFLTRVEREFIPMNDTEQEELMGKVRPFAERLAFYRGTL